MDKLIEQPRGIAHLMRYWPWIATGIFLLALVLWLLLGNHASTLRVAASDLTIADVRQAEFKDYVRLSGQVVPIQVVQLSPEEGGIVTERVAEEGTMVRKGDVIIAKNSSACAIRISTYKSSMPRPNWPRSRTYCATRKWPCSRTGSTTSSNRHSSP